MKEKTILIGILAFFLVSICYFLSVLTYPSIPVNKTFDNILIDGEIDFYIFSKPTAMIHQYTGKAKIENKNYYVDINSDDCYIDGKIDGELHGSGFKGKIKGKLCDCHIEGTAKSNKYQYAGIILSIIGIFVCLYLPQKK